MEFINFPEATRTLGAPKGMTPEEVGSMRVFADGRQCVSCWQPTPAEREAIASGAPIYLGVLVSNDPNQPMYTQPPVFLAVDKPEMAAYRGKPSTKILVAFDYIAKLLPATETIASGLRDGTELAAEQPELRRPDGTELAGGKLYYIGGPAVAAEHYARMVEAYELNGMPGVVEYLQPYEAFLPKEVFTLPS